MHLLVGHAPVKLSFLVGDLAVERGDGGVDQLGHDRLSTIRILSSLRHDDQVAADVAAFGAGELFWARNRWVRRSKSYLLNRAAGPRIPGLPGTSFTANLDPVNFVYQTGHTPVRPLTPSHRDN